MLTNHHEYFTHHYLATRLAEDLAPLLAAWETAAANHPDSPEHLPPPKKLRALSRDFFRPASPAPSSASKSPLPLLSSSPLPASLPGFLSQLLRALNLPCQPTWRTVGEGSAAYRIPLLGEITRSTGEPALWVLQAVPPPADPALDPLTLPVAASQYQGDPAAHDPRHGGSPFPPDLLWEDILGRHVFGQAEPPRWVILVSPATVLLLDRTKWADKRFLSFDLNELYSRKEEASFQTIAALLHRDALCPGEGRPLHDSLDDASNRNAFSVSEKLKEAVRESVELLANEAVAYLRSKNLPLGRDEASFPDELRTACLRYLYRLLFVFYLEARPELGHAPMKSREYLAGYSLESLRDLENIDLTTDHARHGSYFDQSLRLLFNLIYQGRSGFAQLHLPQQQEESASAASPNQKSLIINHKSAAAASQNQESRISNQESASANSFSFPPLPGHLFDPARTPLLEKVRFRNEILQQVVRRLSLGKYGTGRHAREGRISYATLGINQLGAVYESLLSYSGFFAKEDLYEVKPRDEDYDPAIHAYFVPAADLEKFDPEERVHITDPDTRLQRLLVHPKGRFLYRMAGRNRQKSASYYTPESLTRCLVKYALKELLPGKTADDILQLTVCEMAVGSAAFLNEAVNQLAEAYLRLKQQETGLTLSHADYAQEKQKVKMRLADNNVFGVDLNPIARELAEISLWLNTIYKDAFVPWFGLQLHTGNSLVGARRQTYPAHLLKTQPGRGGDKPRWPETPPTQVPWKNDEARITNDENKASPPGTPVSAPAASSSSPGNAGLRTSPASSALGRDVSPQTSAASQRSAGILPAAPQSEIPPTLLSEAKSRQSGASSLGTPVSRPAASSASKPASINQESKIKNQESPSSFDIRHSSFPPRSAGSVYHFLTPDPAMADYGDKVIKNLRPADIRALKDWRSAFTAAFDPADLDTLLKLSDATDRLWQRHLAALASIREKTTDHLPVWPHPPSDKRPTDMAWKDLVLARELRHPCSPYRRLHLAMDYWCALWFWPISKADLLPTRDQWLMELSVILGTTPTAPSLELTQGTLIFNADFGGTPTRVEATVDLHDPSGVVDVDELCRQLPRLALVQDLASRRRFFHWELEFADVFARRGGFDLIAGNPPWVKVEWNEGDLLSDYEPLFAVRDLSAAEIVPLRAEQLRHPKRLAAYFEEYEEAAGTQNFLNAPANYPLLKGQQSNLYKCFITRAWELNSQSGTTGFLHPESVFDDPKGGKLRAALYKKLRKHFQFTNVNLLFQEVMIWVKYSINIYGPSKNQITFDSISNLFATSTTDNCYENNNNILEGIKNSENEWNTAGHLDRIINIDQDSLTLFSTIYDDPNTPFEEARLPALHCKQLVEVLKKFASYHMNIQKMDNQFYSLEMWHETNAQKDNTIKRETRFPISQNELIISGPHIFVSNPYYKTPRAVCDTPRAYDNLHLGELPDNYLPRTNYVLACETPEYEIRTAKTPWDENKKVTDYNRLAYRAMLSQSGERTLIGAILPKKSAHINGIVSVVFKSELTLVSATAISSSILGDFFIKTTGSSNLHYKWTFLPIIENCKPIIARTLALNCLTNHYADLWQECWDEAYRHETWLGDDPRLDPAFWRHLTPQWSRHCALRTDFARRWALVELDVLAARALGLTLAELQTIYRIQFPVLRQNEADTWYDQNGKIVFTARTDSGGLERNEWNEVKHLQTGTVSQTITDDTLPTGPLERTLTYKAPFTRQDRETDYHTVWQKLE